MEGMESFRCFCDDDWLVTEMAMEMDGFFCDGAEVEGMEVLRCL